MGVPQGAGRRICGSTGRGPATPRAAVGWAIRNASLVASGRASSKSADLGAAERLNEYRETFLEATEALRSFVDLSERAIETESKQSEGILGKLTPAKKRADSGHKVYLRLGDSGPEPITPQELQILVKVVAFAHARTTRYPALMLNMAFIYMVALYDAYAADAMTATLEARPEMMKSARQLSYDDVITLVQHGELFGHMARREVADTAYKSFADQVARCKKRFGVDLVPEGVAEDDLIEAFARRNLLVHN